VSCVWFDKVGVQVEKPLAVAVTVKRRRSLARDMMRTHNRHREVGIILPAAEYEGAYSTRRDDRGEHTLPLCGNT
jgi:hypothetical protein